MSKIRTSKIIKRFGAWVVTTYGLENTDHYYPIEASRLWQAEGTGGDWEHHLAVKQWNSGGHEAALKFAREYHAAKRRTRVA